MKLSWTTNQQLLPEAGQSELSTESRFAGRIGFPKSPTVLESAKVKLFPGLVQTELQRSCRVHDSVVGKPDERS